jgi:hypothetical protein
MTAGLAAAPAILLAGPIRRRRDLPVQPPIGTSPPARPDARVRKELVLGLEQGECG